MQFFLLVLCTLTIAAGGYLINDIYDYKADIINKPHKTWVGQQLTVHASWFYYFFLLVSGLLIAAYLAWATENLPLLTLYPGACFILWWYAFRLKKAGLSGNLVVAGMTAFVCIILVIAERRYLLSVEYHKVLVLFSGFSWFSFVINLVREWVKDIEDMEGDMLINSFSLPIMQGIDFVKNLIAVCLGITILSLVIFNVWFPHSFHQKIFSIVFVIAPIVKVAIQIQKSRDRDAYHKSANALKLILLLGLIYLLMFSPLFVPHGIIE
ncbi:MAG: geranylgeranylglycerol-phosphate geranylgeranyltransferase [Saprospiraceae bacterium]